MEKLIGMYENDIEKLSKVLDKLEGTGMACGLVNGMISGLKMVVDDLSKCVRGENLDTGDRQLQAETYAVLVCDGALCY